jgi:hypothetical protein
MTQKIRTATEFRGIVPKGGSTKPWLVEASDVEGNTELYVVKMFTQPVGNLELIQDYLLAVQRAPERFGALLQKQLI